MCDVAGRSHAEATATNANPTTDRIAVFPSPPSHTVVSLLHGDAGRGRQVQSAGTGRPGEMSLGSTRIVHAASTTAIPANKAETRNAVAHPRASACWPICALARGDGGPDSCAACAARSFLIA